MATRDDLRRARKRRLYLQLYYRRNRKRLASAMKRYYRHHRTTIQAYNRAYYQRNSESIKAATAQYARLHRAEANARSKRKRSRDPERYRRRARHYYKQNRAKVKAIQKAYYARHWKRVYAARRMTKWRSRAKQLGAIGEFTWAEFRALCRKSDNRCAHCKKRRPLEADHIVPLQKGGTNMIDNIQPLCHRCNTSKGTKVSRAAALSARKRFINRLLSQI